VFRHRSLKTTIDAEHAEHADKNNAEKDRTSKIRRGAAKRRHRDERIRRWVDQRHIRTHRRTSRPDATACFAGRPRRIALRTL